MKGDVLELPMRRYFHGSPGTTRAIRLAIRRSTESSRTLARRFGINPKTVLKWRKRPDVRDARQEPASTVLSKQEETIAVFFRSYTLLPLDDCLYALQVSIPQLTRSSLHRCWQRHGVSRVPEGSGPGEWWRTRSPIGFFRLDVVEAHTAEGALHQFLAIDRMSKLIYAGLYEEATLRTANHFLNRLIRRVPYKIHTILTDDRALFAEPRQQRTAGARRCPFDMTCARHRIEHQLTRPNHPWNEQQVQRMERVIRQAGNPPHYATRQQLRDHLDAFLVGYNFGKRLKTLSGLTPHQFICKEWQQRPELFRLNPLHQTLGIDFNGKTS